MSCSKCGRNIYSRLERSQGKCSPCAVAEMTPEHRDAINKLIGAAFTGANTAKVEQLVDNALESMREVASRGGDGG